MLKKCVSAAICLLMFSSCSHGKATSPARSTLDSATTSTSAAHPSDVVLQNFATFAEPMAMIPFSDGYLVADKVGKLKFVSADGKKQKTVLDISSNVSSTGERGLLGVAQNNKYHQFIYINYTNSSGDTRVVEYRVSGTTIDASSSRIVLAVDQPYPNHNGGNLVFGPDGYLYIGLGDGGSAGDPQNRAQNKNVLLGKMLRIDPRRNGSAAYSIPPDNPFVGKSGVRAEIWSLGLRNPWRYSFDMKTNDLWIGDVGQNKFEEVDHVALNASKGANFGWSRYEATHDYNDSRSADNVVAPVAEYDHSNGRCAITGGYVYRGKALKGWQGRYIFGDYCSGELWWMSNSGGALNKLNISYAQLVSFAQDRNGELFLLSQGGAIKRLVAKS